MLRLFYADNLRQLSRIEFAAGFDCGEPFPCRDANRVEIHSSMIWRGVLNFDEARAQ